MPEVKAIEFHKIRDFGQTLTVTAEFLRKNFKSLFKSVLFISGPFVIIGSLLITQVFDNFFTLLTGQAAGITPDPSEFINIFGFMMGGLLVLFLGTTTIVASVYDYMVIYEQKGSNEIEVNEVWSKVKRSFWQVLGTIILYGLIILGAYLVLLIPIFILTAINPGLSFLGLIILAAGLAYLTTSSSLTFIIRSYEGVGFGTAFSRSFHLVKSNWWVTFGIVVIASLIRSTVSSVFIVPTYVSFFITMFDSTRTGTFQEPSLILQIINYITLMLYFIINTVLYALPLVVIAFQYFNLVEKKEAKGLMSKIDSFGTTETIEDEEEHY